MKNLVTMQRDAPRGSQGKKKNREPDWRRHKKAFDSVFAAFREYCSVSGVSVMNYAETGKGTRNPARATPTDFRCDVQMVVSHCLKDIKKRVRFELAYMNPEDDDLLVVEKKADRLFARESRSGMESGIGALLIKRGLYPISGKGGYFTSVLQVRSGDRVRAKAEAQLDEVA